MIPFQEDWQKSQAHYRRTAAGISVDGQRDFLYQACVCFPSANLPEQNRVQQMLENLELKWCPYSLLPALELLTRFDGQLTAAARASLQSFLKSSKKDMLQELAHHQYNSFRLLSIAGLLGLSVLDQDQKAEETAVEALYETYVHSHKYSMMDEFLSPFYTAQQLAALAEIRKLPLDRWILQMAAQLEDFIWQGVLNHYEPGLLALTGPCSRGYTSELAGHFQIILACLRRLLGEEAGFTFAETVWNPAYAEIVVLLTKE